MLNYSDQSIVNWLKSPKTHLYWGLVFLFISLSTWAMDWAQIVEHCPFCRTQRTIIGILALIILFRRFNLFFLYLSYALALFGMHVSSAQKFMHIRQGTWLDSFFVNVHPYLASAALFIILLQVIMINFNTYQRLKNIL